MFFVWQTFQQEETLNFPITDFNVKRLEYNITSER